MHWEGNTTSKYNLSFIAVILLGLVLRLYNLTILPVFADEAIYVRWAQVMNAVPSLRFLPLSDGKQPLFMWAVMPMLKVFSDPLFAGRFVSVLAGVGILIGVGVASYLLFKSKEASLLASLFWAISPFCLFFDRMALVDSMLAFFGIWTFIFGLLVTTKRKLIFSVLGGVALGGALLTKSPGVVIAALLPSVLFFADWKEIVGKKIRSIVVFAGLFFVFYLIAFAMYNILRLDANFHMIGSRNLDYLFPLEHLWTNWKDPFLPNIDRAREWFWILGPSSLFITAIVGLLANLKRNFKSVLLTSVWLIIPLLAQSEFAKVFTTRYIFYTVPFFVILAGSIFTIKTRLLKFGVTLFLVVVLFQAFISDRLILTNVEAANLPRTDRSGYLEEWTSGTGIREAAEYIKSVAEGLPAGGQIVVGTEGYFGTLPDGMQMYLQGYRNVIVIGTGLNFGDIPDSLKESAKAGNITFFAVNSSRLKKEFDWQELNLTLVAQYPKALRPDGTHEYVVLGPRETFYLFQVM